MSAYKFSSNIKSQREHSLHIHTQTQHMREKFNLQWIVIVVLMLKPEIVLKKWGNNKKEATKQLQVVCIYHHHRIAIY